MRRLITFMFVLLSITAFGQKRGAKPKIGYDRIYPFHNGIAKVEKDGKQGYIKEDGSELVPCKFDNIYPWEKGRAKVEIAGKFGYIRQSDGEEIVPVKYDYIGPYKNGLAIVMIMGRRGLINENGEEVVQVE